MKIRLGSADVPVIYTAHHASCNFGEFSDRVALTREQRIRFSDYGTDATVPRNGLAAVIAQRSRGVIDLNHDPQDPWRFPSLDFARPIRNPIWLPGKELTGAEKDLVHNTYFVPFHQKITEILKNTRPSQPRLVVAWDNTAHYQIGKDEAGRSVGMKPIILSNRGVQNSPYPGSKEPVSCDPAFLQLLAIRLRAALTLHGLPSDVFINLVYKGGYITRHYTTLRNRNELAMLGVHGNVQSLQLEYDTNLTHDPTTLQARPQNIKALRQAFQTAISAAYRQYFS